MAQKYNTLIMGASYGSLLAIKLLFGDLRVAQKKWNDAIAEYQKVTSMPAKPTSASGQPPTFTARYTTRIETGNQRTCSGKTCNTAQNIY